MRILIADDVSAVRSAIRRLLNEEKDLSIAGEAANLGELMRLVRTSRPDVILLDWELSGLPGSTKPQPDATLPQIQAGKRRNVILFSLRQFPPNPRIVVMSSQPEAEAVSLSAGADGFVLKGGPPGRLIEVIQAVCEG